MCKSISSSRLNLPRVSRAPRDCGSIRAIRRTLERSSFILDFTCCVVSPPLAYSMVAATLMVVTPTDRGAVKSSGARAAQYAAVLSPVLTAVLYVPLFLENISQGRWPDQTPVCSSSPVCPPPKSPPRRNTTSSPTRPLQTLQTLLTGRPPRRPLVQQRTTLGQITNDTSPPRPFSSPSLRRYIAVCQSGSRGAY